MENYGYLLFVLIFFSLFFWAAYFATFKVTQDYSSKKISSNKISKDYIEAIHMTLEIIDYIEKDGYAIDGSVRYKERKTLGKLKNYFSGIRPDITLKRNGYSKVGDYYWASIKLKIN